MFARSILILAAVSLAACGDDVRPTQNVGVTISGHVAKANFLNPAPDGELHVVWTPGGLTFDDVACTDSIDWAPGTDVHWRHIRTFDASVNFPMSYTVSEKTYEGRARVFGVYTARSEELLDRISNRRPPVTSETIFGVSNAIEFMRCRSSTSTTCYQGSVEGTDLELVDTFTGCAE